jgi:hypothetical protein
MVGAILLGVGLVSTQKAVVILLPGKMSSQQTAGEFDELLDFFGREPTR